LIRTTKTPQLSKNFARVGSIADRQSEGGAGGQLNKLCKFGQKRKKGSIKRDAFRRGRQPVRSVEASGRSETGKGRKEEGGEVGGGEQHLKSIPGWGGGGRVHKKVAFSGGWIFEWGGEIPI